MKTRLLFLVTIILLTLFGVARGVTVATPPVGYFRLDAGGGRDNWISLPLVRRSESIRRIDSIGPASLSLSGSALIANAYAPSATGSYYVQFVSGNLAGLSYKIISNTANEVTLATLGDDLSAHVLGAINSGPAGDLVRIRPFWTVADIFGRENAGLLLDPVSALDATIYTEADALLFPDNQTIATEKAPAAVVAYVAGQGWRRQGQPATDSGADEFPPGVPFILRRENTTPISTFIVGYVSQEPGLIRLPALAAAGETDVAVGLFHPGPMQMADLGLVGTMENSADADSAHDLLLSPSDIRNGFSVPPAHRLHLVNGAWFEGDTPADGRTLQSGTGFILRVRGGRTVRYWRQTITN